MVGSMFPLQSFHFLYPDRVYIRYFFFRPKLIILQRLRCVVATVQIFY